MRLARKIDGKLPRGVSAQALELLASEICIKVGILGVAYKSNIDVCRGPSRSNFSCVRINFLLT